LAFFCSRRFSRTFHFLEDFPQRVLLFFSLFDQIQQCRFYAGNQPFLYILIIFLLASLI